MKMSPFLRTDVHITQPESPKRRNILIFTIVLIEIDFGQLRLQ